MRFWDTSAIVPLAAQEAATDALKGVLAADEDMVVWWGTIVECASAVARRRRDGPFSAADERMALTILERLATSWSTVAPTEAVRERARRLVRIHPLRAADALQLGAALAWAEDTPRERGFITLDERLAEAARLEGFSVTCPPPPQPTD